MSYTPFKISQEKEMLAALPEQVLVLAIIQQAQHDVLFFKDLNIATLNRVHEYDMLTKYHNAKQAQRWIHDPSSSLNDPFSFIWCSEYAFTERNGIDKRAAISSIRSITKFDIPFSENWLPKSYKSEKEIWEP